MEEAPTPNVVMKTTNTISSAMSKTSCNSGWLRFAVQTIFCTIIVVCFIFIVTNSMKRSPKYLDKPRPDRLRNCFETQCQVLCSQASLDEEFENDMIFTIMVAQMTCKEINVTVYRPDQNKPTLSVNWLTRVQAKIASLKFIGGHMVHILTNTFMGRYTKNLKSLKLEEVTISNWHPDMLIGLIHVEELEIRDCSIGTIHKKALRSVADSLERLVIRMCGKWDPTHLTGSSYLAKLTEVDFSSNNFGDILTSNSFSELRYCEILRLSSSRITCLQSGTFDFLLNIKIIYLNHNYLTTIPAGLFERITKLMHPKPQIDLQSNLWHCDCSQFKKFMPLHNEGVLLLEPYCYTPEFIYGQLISTSRSFCRRNTSQPESNLRYLSENDTSTVYLDGKCKYTESSLNYTEIEELNNDNENLFQEVYNCSNREIHYLEEVDSKLHDSEDKTRYFYPELYLSFHNFGKKSKMLQVQVFPAGNGLIWFQSECPEQKYCYDNVQDELIIKNIELKVSYTICPILVKSSNLLVRKDKCIVFTPLIEDIKANLILVTKKRIKVYLYGLSLLGAVVFGATLLYGLILKRPTLMRGYKQALIVKHKQAHAMDLPPKVPFRSLPEPPVERKNAGPQRYNRCLSPTTPRTGSMRSYKSHAPSYISAIQPTEDQLMEWRLRQHFKNDYNSDAISFIYEGESIYCSIPPISENIYEHPITPKHLRKYLNS